MSYRGSPIIATLVFLHSLLRGVSIDRNVDGPVDWVLGLLFFGFGASVAVALWRGRPSALRAYAAWAVAALAFHLYRDVQVEPVPWLVVVGALLFGVSLLVVGLFARRTRARSLRSS